ncbi:MAG: hypothetical protein A2511_08835 [Deltaproteobacteria bacterium RIFOXYD12_FULL_50_9]|nr:MAG: hypothetical protein A2511_08835 [Deltaproteobacteria bacterium RIFOXYD12_FULL_50_9]
MEILKILVRDGKAVIKCPICLESKTVVAGRLVKHLLTVRCKCNYIFTVQLEFRRKKRKQTSLAGYYRRRYQTLEWAEIHWESERINILKINCKVVNVSSEGIGFIPFDVYDIKLGDYIVIRFVLDDSAPTVLFKRAIVRVVLENYVGCEFVEADKNDKDIGFYLLQ